MEAVIDDGHVGLSLGQLDEPGRIRLIAVVRSGRTFIPTSEYRTQAKDTVICAVQSHCLGALERKLNGKRRGR